MFAFVEKKRENYGKLGGNAMLRRSDVGEVFRTNLELNFCQQIVKEIASVEQQLSLSFCHCVICQEKRFNSLETQIRRPKTHIHFFGKFLP